MIGFWIVWLIAVVIWAIATGAHISIVAVIVGAVVVVALSWRDPE